jgi:putative transposase
MRSVTLLSAARQMASQVGDPEDALYGNVSSAMGDVLRCFLEAAAESEVERRTGLALHKRSSPSSPRRDYRNGYREREVQTECGPIRIQLPRVRVGGFVPGFLRPGHRALRGVREWVYQALMCGVSVSELSRLLERQTGFAPSRSILQETAARLDAEVKRFKERRLSGTHRYLFLDAAWVKDLVGRSTGRVCVLMAIGVTPDGHKEILGFQRARMENAQAWRGFLMRLLERGVDRAGIDLVISDEHKAILEAVEEVLGDVRHQLCWAHRVRNIRDDVKAADRTEVVAGLRRIYRATHLGAADSAISAFCTTWGEAYPAVVAKLRRDSRYLLAFFDAPAEHREYVRTTNPIERTFRELRRWRRGCGAFANPQACDRVFYKVAMLLNHRWNDRSLWDDPRRRRAQRRARQALARVPALDQHDLLQAVFPQA